MGYTTVTYTYIEKVPFTEINREILDYTDRRFKNIDEYIAYLKNLTVTEQCRLYDYLDNAFGGPLGDFEFEDLISNEEDYNYAKNLIDGEV